MPDVERNYYVLCDDNCRFPAMTAEQIIEAIAEATGNVPEHVDDAFITKIKESNRNSALTFWKGTEAEFNALGVTAVAYKVGIDSNGKLYFTPQGESVPAHASTHGVSGEDPISPEDIGAAAASHNHNASDINSGTLAVARGGTGQTTGNAALNSMLAAGATVLSANQYGTTLPAAGTPGRLFFLKVTVT